MEGGDTVGRGKKTAAPARVHTPKSEANTFRHILDFGTMDCFLICLFVVAVFLDIAEHQWLMNSYS
ncbi:MAG: hypothetical protein FD151_1976 [bacterium]|nr:MAG: hypothetical protein FD151_1976 [bacterium]